MGIKINLRQPILSLFLLALLIRLGAALPLQQPGYMDATYYYVNAINLVEDRGFVEDFVWHYLDAPAPPPRPSHLYWMPLTSILAWLGMTVGGNTFRAAQMPFVLLSVGLAVVGYQTARTLGGARRHGWLAGLLVIFSGFYFPYWATTDNFAPFALFGSLALLLAASPRAPARLSLFAAGVCVGLAHLTRADGALLLVAIAGWLVFRRRNVSAIVRLLLPLVGGYLLAMLPWLIRNWQVAGTLLSVAGTKTIWLAGYDDLFSYGRDLSATTFLAQGIGPVLQGRWWAFTINLQTVLAVWGMIFLTPLALLGGWQLRRQPLTQLVGLYAGLLFVAMTLVFAFPGARGGLFHSGGMLLPAIAALAVLGLDAAVDWVAARRRGWHAATAKRVFGVGLVVMAVALSSFIYYGRVIKNNAWNNADRGYAAVARWVHQHDAQATVMINNPPGYRYWGGGLSVVVPNADPPLLLDAAQEYGVDYLILDKNHPAPLANLYANPDSRAEFKQVEQIGTTLIFEINP
jgi:4-amino-4-deoxy-L-arabinose transferase-like glycosyltransferase